MKYIAAPTGLYVPSLSPLNEGNVADYSDLLSKYNSYKSVYSSNDVQVYGNGAALPWIFGQSAVVTLAGSFSEFGLFQAATTKLSGHPLMTSFPFGLDSKETVNLLETSDWIVAGRNYSDYLLSQVLPSEYTYPPTVGVKLTGNWLPPDLPRSFPYLLPSFVAYYMFSSGPYWTIESQNEKARGGEWCRYD